MKGELSCIGLSKVFSNGKEALTSVDMKVPTKGIFSLIGRNGAGKTTLTRILSTVLEPSSGHAIIDDLDVMDDAPALRERMAIVPQEGRPIHWLTPKQYISSYLMWRGYDYKESRRKAEEAIGRIGLTEYADTLNRNLSGGMKRKVSVAMVVASECDFIFLDEPSTGLDPISRRELWDLIVSESRDRFLFLTTHYLEEAEYIADRIGVLNEGRLISIGDMDHLRNNNGYSYCITVKERTDLPEIDGEVTIRKDGWIKVMTTEEEAMTISKGLIERKAHFSMNPVTLDDIFSSIINNENGDLNEG